LKTYRFFFNDWPDGWNRIYKEHSIFQDDPVIAEARQRMTLFLWSEIKDQRVLSARERQIGQLVEDYGWREVVGVPIHGPNGYQGLVSLGSLTAAGVAPLARALIQCLSVAIHNRCRTEIDFGMEPQWAPKLASREIECLEWVAAGKTDREIGVLLGISSATAHYHVESAKRKLGVSTRVQAIALLSLRGIV
jgi:LuxR family quorum sensing-dependent transcriptional regulator